MAQLLWTMGLETGISKVDDEHKELVNKINYLDKIASTMNFENIKTALQDLIDYTVFHFKEEEEMLERSGYKLLEPHKNVHKNFLNKIGTLQAEFHNGDFQAITKINELCEGWLFRHIQLNDHGYVNDVKKALKELNEPMNV